MNHFLFKTEPSGYSIDDLKYDKKTSWGEKVWDTFARLIEIF